MSDRTATRILMVDDHLLLRGALARVLSAEPGFEIAGECASVEDALRIVRRTPVDIVLLDIDLGSEQGGVFLNRAEGMGYRGKVLVVTAGVGAREAAWLLHRGCAGIFLKDEPVAHLVERIHEIVRGDQPLDQASLERIVAPLDQEPPHSRALTYRENQVLRCVCEGLSNKEIAQQLEISEESVKSFVRQLFAKTGARSRAQLVALAIEHYWDQL